MNAGPLTNHRRSLHHRQLLRENILKAQCQSRKMEDFKHENRKDLM